VSEPPTPPFNAPPSVPKPVGTTPPVPPSFAAPAKPPSPVRPANDTGAGSAAANFPHSILPGTTPSSPALNMAKTSSARAKLIIQRGGTIGKEFNLTDTESNIGRWDADGGIFPDVDLDQDDPEAKVSRRHARIIHQNGQYLIEDLGSTNGTFINRGRRLLPGNRHPLNNGDEIIVGKTFLKFIVE
jgi:hypothetical protein